MPDIQRPLTLLELNAKVRQAIEENLDSEYWVEAEIAEVHETRGIGYIGLVERTEGMNAPVAKADAKCWRQTWTILNSYFRQETGQPIRPGIKVMLKVYAQFHEAYGFSWIITDINPKYTIGDLAKKRLEIINKLKEDGVWDMNRTLHFPLFAQRIAVISGNNAAGYGDFINQLAHNEYGYSFKTKLFQAIMQGEMAEKSIIEALNDIYETINDFDCVVIIRGGGAQSDLQGFDSYLLALNVAQFPLPIITGIGHDRDVCVLDMVAHTRVKTPTAAAAFLIANLKGADDRIRKASETVYSIPLLRIRESRAYLELAENRLTSAAMLKIVGDRHKIDLLEQRAKAQDPLKLLERGYSITTIDGKIITDASRLSEGDEIMTLFNKGKVKSIISENYGNKQI